MKLTDLNFKVLTPAPERARLIAAAPQMLALLQDLQAHLQCIVTAANHNDLSTINIVAKSKRINNTN